MATHAGRLGTGIELRRNTDGSAVYRAKVRLRGHPPQTATFRRLTDAKRWRVPTEAAIREGRHFKAAEAKRHTLSELIDRYCADVLPTKRGNARNTRRLLTWWKGKIGHALLADITPDMRQYPVRVVIPARLAVSRKHKRRSGGVGTLQDAIRRRLAIAKQAGVRAMLMLPLSKTRRASTPVRRHRLAAARAATAPPARMAQKVVQRCARRRFPALPITGKSAA